MANLIQIKRSLTTSVPAALANGELAYSANGDHLFVGSNGSVVHIGGLYNYGVLTANQALVANSTSGIDKVIVANLVPTAVYANGSFGTAGQVLTSNGSTVHWAVPVTTIDGLSDVTIASVANNDLLVYDATAGQWENHTIGGNTSQVDILFSNQNISVVLANSVVLPTSLSVGTDVVLNTTSLAVGNSSVNTVITSTAINTDGTLDVLGAATLSNTITVTGFANLQNVVAAGNTTVTGWVNATASVNASSLTVGTSFIANSTGAYHTGTVNAAIHSVGSDVIANSLGVFATGTVNAAVLSVGSSFVANTTAVTASVPTSFTANVSLGDFTTDIVSINGKVNTNIIPNANVTYVLGNNSNRWAEIHTANVHAVSGYFEGSVQVTGDLTVSGNVTTVNVSSLQVTDPMIYLAGNNYTSDLLDIGFVGNYYDGSFQRHAGLVRHAADDEFYLFHKYKTEPDNNVIDVANVASDFTIAMLNTYLTSGALTSNSSALAITANSTVSVNITANTVTLNTPLAATSGGTGHASFATGDVFVAANATHISKLGLGADGTVLQSNGSTVVYATLDGGTF